MIDYIEPDSNLLEPANPNTAGYPDQEREEKEAQKDIEIDNAWKQHQDNQPPF